MANCKECKNRIRCENYAPKSTTACEHYAEEVQQLKPCPFCGSKDVDIFAPVNKDTIGRAVHCNSCNTRVGFPNAYDEIQATEYWNRRAENERKTD